jgi:hypothetical protein
MDHRKWCPRCGQGWVVPVRVTATGEIVQFCLECDATWRKDVKELGAERYSETGEPGTFMDLSTFLESQGLKYGPGAIENVYSENEGLW